MINDTFRNESGHLPLFWRDRWQPVITHETEKIQKKNCEWISQSRIKYLPTIPHESYSLIKVK